MRQKQAKGPQLIKVQLIQKGVEKDIIESVLDKNSNSMQIAKIALSKKINKWKNLPKQEMKKKAYAYLASRGFDYDSIKETFAFLEKKR